MLGSVAQSKSEKAVIDEFGEAEYIKPHCMIPCTYLNILFTRATLYMLDRSYTDMLHLQHTIDQI